MASRSSNDFARDFSSHGRCPDLRYLFGGAEPVEPSISEACGLAGTVV